MSLVVHIVDDDDGVRDSTQALLDACGYEVCQHSSAEDFLQCTRHGRECLVLDHHMPGMTGLGLLEFLVAHNMQLPTLMVTGRGDPTLEAKVTQMGAKYLTKPVDAEALLEWVEQMQRHSQTLL